MQFGEIVWSVHPCHVQDVIAEILALDPWNDPPTRNAGTSSGVIQKEFKNSAVGIDEASQLQAQIRWLDCWFMVTSTLFNLRS
jgi:hypothetical protein